VAAVIERGEARRGAADDGRPDCAQPGRALAESELLFGAELIGAPLDVIRRAEDRSSSATP